MSHHSYSYLERRYSKKTSLQVFLLAAVMTAVLIGALVAVQMSETTNEANARAESDFKTERSVDRQRLREEQQDYVTIACGQSKKACDEAQEKVRQQNCQLYGEGCQGRGTNRRPASFMESLDKLVQERMRNPQ